MRFYFYKSEARRYVWHAVCGAGAAQCAVRARRSVRCGRGAVCGVRVRGAARCAEHGAVRVRSAGAAQCAEHGAVRVRSAGAARCAERRGVWSAGARCAERVCAERGAGVMAIIDGTIYESLKVFVGKRKRLAFKNGLHNLLNSI